MAVPAAFNRLRRFDWGLLTATVFLLLVGLAAIASLSLNAPEPDLTTLIRQLIFAGLGLLGLFVISTVNYRFFQSAGWLIYGTGLLLLLGVLLFGTTIHGTRAWFLLFDQTFQPVELVKVFLIIVLAKIFSERFDPTRPWRALGVTGLVVAPAVILVFLQPDVGSVLVLVGLWFGLLALARVPMRFLFGLALIAALVAVAAWFVVLQDFQRERILTFFDPSRDPLGIGYNLRQSQVAVGSGQLFGRGLGLGPQSQLDFLPVQETDFLFAVIAEELGFVGSALVFTLYGFLFWRLFRIVRGTTDDFAAFVSGGVIILLFVQVGVNIGMNIGLLPVAGLPLPLMSYGGSSLISTLLLIGVVESIAIRSRRERVGDRVGAPAA
ncbi:MAG: rod shape-determining protein RodA [Candidatus Kerfeldbacteria bacterium]|nr:rod shape-determining protein RodA [Candidatus Kerfeldbacteria bacterium]